ncbi:MAG: glycosyltransferase family 2 protein [Thermodesulfobacteriota bacterium]|nr:glycosyltransferase family 2 protein [Thermodesulfobacteriota bacterium]
MISIIVVNWNSGRQLYDLVHSIVKYHNNVVDSLIIIDNASFDDSLPGIEGISEVPFGLRLIQNKRNWGFAAACNQGAALADSDYLLFLNPDTRLFNDSLQVAVKFMEETENVDIAIAGVQLVNENNEIARSCSRFPSLGIFCAKSLGLNRLPSCWRLSQRMREWEHNVTRQVDQVMGAFFLIRRSVFETMGGFDQRFFMYFEEVDLSLRARDAGWGSIFIAEAQAFHAGGGCSRQVMPYRLFYSLRSRLLFGFKHFGILEVLLLVVVTLGLESISRLILGFRQGSLTDVRNTLEAYRMLYLDLPNVLQKAVHR